MRRRLAALALAALLACASLAPISEAAHRHNSGHVAYRGKTSQGNRIQLSTSPGRITLIRFKAKMLCRDGSLLFGDASDFEAAPLKRGGRFSDVQYGKTDVVSWRGRVGKGKITGTLRVKVRLASGVRCDSQPLSFSAERAGRRP